MVLIPRPLHCGRGDRRVESPLTELEFGVVHAVAALHQPERKASGPAFDGRMVAGVGRLDEGLVAPLQEGRETAELAPVQRR